MKPIAVWYHCCLSGPGIPSAEQAVNILAEQMWALKASGLSDAAAELHIGINGPVEDQLLAMGLAPEKSVFHRYGPESRGEGHTLRQMKQSLQPGNYVLYHHTKGVTHPGDGYAPWRRCMQRVCVENWRRCVDQLERGAETVGAHWLSHDRYTLIHPTQQYWGGTFWWASSDYLLTLPPIVVDDVNGKCYEAEVWIGKCGRHPRAVDLANHWPMQGC